MITDGDFICRLAHFPGDINAILRVDAEGYGNIYVNDQLSPMAQKKAFEHEILHLIRGDMFTSKNIREVEG